MPGEQGEPKRHGPTIATRPLPGAAPFAHRRAARAAVGVIMRPMHGVHPGDERTVVVVEDDEEIGALVDTYLRRAGFRVLLATTGERGLELAEMHRPQLVILDIGLAGIDGLETGRQLRRRSDVPLLFLTARDGEVDRLAAFDGGADDYVTKPFSPRELVRRVEAITRRGRRADDPPTSVSLGSVTLNRGGRSVTVDGEPIDLATREFDLLDHLLTNVGLVLSRRQLVDAVWGPGWDGDERTVDTHVRQLRRKFGAALAVSTVWGVGYRLDDPGDVR